MQSNVSIFRRHERAQDAMLKATMPKSGVVEYIDLIPRVPKSGRVWRAGVVEQKPVGTRLRRAA